MTKLCYSTNQEDYHEAESKDCEGAALEAMNDLLGEAEPGEVRTVWVGEVKPAVEFLRSRECWIAEDVIERLEELLADEISADDTIIKMPPHKVYDLGKLILDYLEEHATFTRFGVANTTEHKVIVSEAA